MRYPQGLKPSGTIGFVAPSFGCGEEPFRTMFELAQQAFVRRGYRLDLGPNCYEEKGIGISNTPQACGEELTEWYCRKENDVLISCGGGELMCEILDYVDFERIRRAEPKWYMGLSDNTNFTFLLTTLCDTASIYGPCAGSFAMNPWDPSLQDAFDLLTGEKTWVQGYPLWEKGGMDMEETMRNRDPEAPYRLTEPKILRSYVGGRPAAGGEEIRFRGRLVGGCLDCLANLAGTSYDQVEAFAGRNRDEGIIWFLESCDLTVMSVRRAIWELKHAGWFSHVKGFLIGRPLHFGEELMGAGSVPCGPGFAGGAECAGDHGRGPGTSPAVHAHPVRGHGGSDGAGQRYPDLLWKRMTTGTAGAAEDDIPQPPFWRVKS